MNESRTLVMGILNITPDSFADGGRYNTFELALDRAHQMIAEGVDIIDVGGESTRPGAERVSAEEEVNRVIPIITELKELGVPTSIDTMRASTAAAAINAGVSYVNDVSGGLADPEMAQLIARSPEIQYVAMHWRGHSANMQEAATYKDVVKEVKNELEARSEALIKAGIDAERLILDPGLGFSKTAEHNWELLRNLDRLSFLGFPLLVGASRKSFLGALLNGAGPDDRESASVAITTELAREGIWGVRTHSVKPHRDAIEVVGELSK